ncbi:MULTISPECIES: DUF2062 domain-containing protein [Fictibacillus]|uniref:DUF2062 domain-containing protein n=1 Tax=Fictibacillus TaxID=1329200 RepID=UPI00041FEF42
MHKQTNKYNFIQRLYRAFRLNIIKLLRSPGGARKVSLGFAIGFGLEMVVISSAALVYLLFYPIVRLSGGSFPAAIIGNVIGKLSFLPVILLPFAKKLGGWIYPSRNRGSGIHKHSILEIFSGNFDVLKDLLHGGLHVLIGMTIFGIVLGFASYFPVYYLYEKQRQRRMNKKNSIPL